MKNSLILFLLVSTGCVNTIPQYTVEEISSGNLARLDSKKLKFYLLILKLGLTLLMMKKETRL